jgi:hypothetical protein
MHPSQHIFNSDELYTGKWETLPKVNNTATKVRIYSKQSVSGGDAKHRLLPQSSTNHSSHFPAKSNFLLITIDEARYPPGYENAEIQKWRKEYLPAQEILRNNGMEFHRH